MAKLNDQVDIHRTNHLKIDVVAEDGGSITAQSVQTQLLLAILEKLEEIRCGLIDVEEAIKPR